MRTALFTDVGIYEACNNKMRYYRKSVMRRVYLVPILGIHPEGTLRTFCVLHKGGLLHNMMGITHAMDPLLFVVAPMQ